MVFNARDSVLIQAVFMVFQLGILINSTMSAPRCKQNLPIAEQKTFSGHTPPKLSNQPPIAAALAALKDVNANVMFQGGQLRAVCIIIDFSIGLSVMSMQGRAVYHMRAVSTGVRP
jgi:hypothetical protein